MKHLTAEWIEKAEEDFFSASHLAAAEKLTPHNVTCFPCQQAGEKWLKARLCEDACPSQRPTICASCLYFSRMRIPNG